MRRSLAVALLLALSSACFEEKPDSTSNIEGYSGAVASRLASPPGLSSARVARVGQSIAQVGRKSLISAVARPGGAHPGRQALQDGYLRAALAEQGIPRAQGLEIVRKVVTGDHGLCDGSSCARVFGVEPPDVEGLFDQALVEVAASERLAKEKSQGKRSLLLASLATEGTLAGRPDIRVKDQVARLFLGTALLLPHTGEKPRIEVTHNLAAEVVGEDFLHAIEGYTGANFTTIREVESFTDEELIRKGWFPEPIALWRQQSNAIHRGFGKLPAYQGTVFRGMHRIKSEQILGWMLAMDRKEAIGFGVDNRPALTSATWDPLKAKKFAAKFRWNANQFSVFMIIEQTRGLSIEQISDIKGEKEILLPRDGRYLIQAMAPVIGHSGFLMIKLKEVASSPE